MKLSTFARNRLGESDVGDLIAGLSAMGFDPDMLADAEAEMLNGISESKSEYDFEKDFLIPYGHPRKLKRKSLSRWNQLALRDIEQVVKSLPKYKRYLRHTGHSQMLPTTYLNKDSRHWMDFQPNEEENRYLNIARWLIKYFRENWKWEGYKEPTLERAFMAVERLYKNCQVEDHKDIQRVAQWMTEYWSRPEGQQYWPSINPIVVCNPKKWYTRVEIARDYLS